jgi:FkbM family methyltransferase
MIAPHFLKYLKYRSDFYLTYFRSLGWRDGLRALMRVRILPKGANQEIELALDRPGLHLTIRNNPGDIDAFEKIFVLCEYELPTKMEITSILDLGANIGLSACWFTRRFPEARIIAVEPDEANLAVLRKNMRNSDKIEARRAVVWNREGSFRISNPNDRPDSYRMAPCAADAPDAIEGLTVSGLCKRYGNFDIIKIDIEGAEEQVIGTEPQPWFANCKMIVAEFHSDDLREQGYRALTPAFPHNAVIGENHYFWKK